MSILLEAKQVSKFFGGVKAVNMVDMQIEKGEIFGIIGPNGAGKTTFFNVISGLYTPSNGDIWFKGEKITGIIPEKVAKMGMARTFQNIRLFVNMSVTDNIKIGFHTRTKTNFVDAFVHSKRFKSDEKLATEKSLELLDEVGLSEYANYQAGKLAYGTQRKVEIVRALALNPEILLLDEPAAGMNPAETESLMLFVKELNQRGYTVAVIEHDMKFIMHLCDRIMVLDHGNKIAEGLPEEIKDDQYVIEAYFGSRAVI